MSAILTIKQLSKSYSPEKKAVIDANLTIEQGEIFGFIGHNGAGKTTTMKCVVGILDYEEGEIFVNGVNIKESPIEAKKQIAYIPDNPDLYEALTGIQFLNFICDIYQVDKRTRKESIIKYADLFELTSNLGDMINTYSHGMKQKLALISAFVRKPKLLILDEPFVGLDPRAAFRVKELMKELTNEGASIFFSTHILEVAEKLCSKVAIIQRGKIVKIGTMDDVRGDGSLENVFLELIDNA